MVQAVTHSLGRSLGLSWKKYLYLNLVQFKRGVNERESHFLDINKKKNIKIIVHQLLVLHLE